MIKYDRYDVILMFVFSGMGGHYELDDSGDRDLNLSVVYTTSSYKVSHFCIIL